MLAAIIAAQLLVIVWLVYDKRVERQQHAELLRSRTPDLEAMIDLTDRLCQRLQAPHVAVAEHTTTTLGDYAPPAVPIEDDEAYWEAKDALADRLMDEELSGGPA